MERYLKREISDVIDRLDRLLPDPNYLAYTVDRTPELPASEVVRAAFAYRPIIR